MSARAPREAGSFRSERVRPVGAVLLAALVLLTAIQPVWTQRLQGAWFDGHQVLFPRRVSALPVTVVEIDQKSLLEVGQWPWPRTRLARLIDAIEKAHPEAIALNVLMPEADALSPERLLAQTPLQDATVLAALQSMPTNDALLGRALAGAPTVLAVAGTQEPTGMSLRAAPVTVRNTRAGNEEAPGLIGYAGVLASIDELDRQASGRGLISVDPTRGIVRRIPLVASIQGTLVPTLAVEMLRVAMRAPTVRLTTEGSVVTALAVGALRTPTEADGAVRVYFSPHRADRFVSAADVLQGRVDPALLHRQLVLIGPSALGLGQSYDTPINETMTGSEIHAQLLENLLAGNLLRRPRWAPAVEALWLAALGGLLVWATPRLRPLRGIGVLAGGFVLPIVLAFAMFRWQGWLLDAVTPGLYLTLLSAVLLALSLSESNRHRRQLSGVVAQQREASARMAGELQAAQRIQAGSLPPADLLRGDSRVDLHALLTAAREVGGDLYDFFRLDEHRLFLLVGDVAGKGLSASIFMTVSKALVKGSMLRARDAHDVQDVRNAQQAQTAQCAPGHPAPGPDLGAVMQEANAEVSRDNAEMLFVTAFAAILDLRSGELSYCNAGHDNPYLLRRGDASPLRIEDGDGPPLCAMAQFPYRSACRRLAPGDWLFVMTDGVTDARNLAGEVYGPARLERLLVEQVGAEPQASSLVAALKADLAAFVEGAEPFDDITILALRWRGPAGEAPSEAMAAAPAGLVPAAQAPALSPASSSPVPILGARLSGPQA